MKTNNAIKAPVSSKDKKKKDDCKCNLNCNCCENREKQKTDAVKKSVVLTSMLALFATQAFAQETTSQPSFWTDPFNSPMLPLYVTMAFFIVTIVLIILVMIYVVKVLNFFTRQAEIERAAKLGIPVKVRQSWWSKMWDQANDVVPIEQEDKVDTGHEYDGIRELDNHLPPWWKGLFYATIVWGVVYIIVYHVTDNLPLSIGEYQNELARAEENARLLKASQPGELIDENSLEYIADEAILVRGKTVFVSNNCASCHRADGGGNTIGPNLTDPYWLHGGSVKNVFSTINAGVVEKGMPAWGKIMSPRDVRDVTFYIMSLSGSNPPDGKAPQGELYAPEKPATFPDSVVAQVIHQ